MLHLCKNAVTNEQNKLLKSMGHLVKVGQYFYIDVQQMGINQGKRGKTVDSITETDEVESG